MFPPDSREETPERVKSSDNSKTLHVRTTLIDVALPDFSTTGLLRGNYKLVVTVTDTTGIPIPGGTGIGSLIVGTPVSATITVSPTTTVAGNSTVTNTLQINALTTFTKYAGFQRLR